MQYQRPDALVSTEWLALHLADKDLRVVDGTYIIPPSTRDARQEFDARHIPGAVFFDIDEVCDQANPLPHMLPKPAAFSSAARKLGLGDGSRIVAYDTHGMVTAARVWWMFRIFGHKNVAVLDGGLPKWIKESRQTVGTETGSAAGALAARHFTARFNKNLLRDIAQIKANLDKRQEQVVDARSAGRFKAIDPEPRVGLRGGHMPGALNLPYTELLDPADKTFLSADRLAARFQTAGIDMQKPIVTSCGSGVTACVLALGLYLLGRDDVAVYDGSWTEWGGRKDTPIVTG